MSPRNCVGNTIVRGVMFCTVYDQDSGAVLPGQCVILHSGTLELDNYENV